MNFLRKFMEVCEGFINKFSPEFRLVLSALMVIWSVVKLHSYHYSENSITGVTLGLFAWTFVFTDEFVSYGNECKACLKKKIENINREVTDLQISVGGSFGKYPAVKIEDVKVVRN